MIQTQIHNKELETAIISTILFDINAMDMTLKAVRDRVNFFYDNRLRNIYAACYEAVNEGYQPSVQKISEKTGLSVYDLTQITMIDNVSLTIQNFTTLKQNLYSLECLWRRRELYTKCMEAVKYITLDEEDLANKILLKEIPKIFEDGNSDVVRNITEIGQTYIETIQKQKETGLVLGIMSGYDSLDRFTGGWQSGDTIVIAARPSVGKTAFMIEIANRAAKQGKRVLLISMEMKGENITRRLFAATGEINLNSFKQPSEMPDLILEKVKKNYKDNIIGLPIFIDDECEVNLESIKRKAKAVEADLIMIDYLQLTEGDKKGNREQEISHITRGLKKLAMNLEVPIIELSQLNRGINEFTKPELANLRESGSIEQDANMVIFLYKNEQGQRIASIAKNRDGELGQVYFDFVGQYQQFKELPTDGFQPRQVMPENYF